MTVRFYSCVVLLWLSGPALAADVKEATAPAIVVRVTSLGDLLADVKYVAALDRGQEGVKHVEEFVARNFGQERAGLDVNRPAGFYVASNNLDGIVLLLPIADEKKFLKAVAGWFGEPTKDDDGIYQFRRGWFSPEYLRFAHRYAYLSWGVKELLAKERLLGPDQVLASKRSATLSAVFHLDRVPADVRLGGLEQWNEYIARTTAKIPGETELQRKLRMKVLENIARWVSTAAKEGDRLEMGMGVDRRVGELFAEVELSGKANSPLAAAIAELGQARSRFVGLPESAALKLLLHWSLADDLTEAVRPVLDEGIRKAMQNAAADTVREHAVKLVQALDPTLQPGALDAGVALLGPNSDNLYTLIAGVKVTDGAAIDAAVRGLVRSLPERDRDKFKFDAVILTRGVHRAEVQDDLDEKAQRTFGRQPVYFTIHDDALWLAHGPEALAALKEALASPAKMAPQLHYEMSLRRLVPLMTTDPAALKKTRALAQELFGNAEDCDRVRLTIAGGQTLKARLSMRSGVVTFLSKTQGQDNGMFWFFLR